MEKETFKDVLESIKKSERQIEEFVKVARLAERPRKESRLSGEQQYCVMLTAIVTGSIAAVLLTLIVRLT